MTNTEQIRTKKISFILALSVLIFAAIATYFTLCHDINIMRITTPVILGLAMAIILCGVLQKFFYNWLTKNPIHFSFSEQSSPVIESESTTEPVCIAEIPLPNNRRIILNRSIIHPHSQIKNLSYLIAPMNLIWKSMIPFWKNSKRKN